MATSEDTDTKAKRASKVDALRHLVGVETDAEVARRAGVVPETVRIYRIRNGIPSARQTEAANRGPNSGEPKAEPKRSRNRAKKAETEATALEPGPVKPRKAGVASPIDPYVHLLGTMPDTALAQQLGVTRGAVYQYRRHRAIPAYVDPESAPRRKPVAASAPAPAAASAPARREARGGRFSYVVAVSRGGQDRSYSVVASDIADAYQKAVAALGEGARVTSVTQHLEAL